MVIAAAAILTILTRQPGSEALIDALEAAPPPHFVTPLSVFEAVTGLARSRGRFPDDNFNLARAQDAVAAFVDAVGAKEVILSADLGRRALDVAVRHREAAELCFARACAGAYRTSLLLP